MFDAFGSSTTIATSDYIMSASYCRTMNFFSVVAICTSLFYS